MFPKKNKKSDSNTMPTRQRGKHSRDAGHTPAAAAGSRCKIYDMMNRLWDSTLPCYANL